MHFEYCSPLVFIRISRTLNNKLERAYDYASRSILNLVRSRYSRFMSFSIASMKTLEKRRKEKSLILFFQGFKMQSPSYISNFFKPRVTNYYLRGSGINVLQPSYIKVIIIVIVIAFFLYSLLIDPINRSEIGCRS